MVKISQKIWLFAYFWSWDKARDRIPLSQAGNAYKSAKLNVLQTSTIPLSPPVKRYSPSLDITKHCKKKITKIQFFREMYHTNFNHFFTWIWSLWISWRNLFPFAVKATTWPPGKLATTNPSRDKAKLVGLFIFSGVSKDLKRSPKVVCTNIGPSEIRLGKIVNFGNFKSRTLYRPGQPNWEYTMLKIQDFSASQILRENNFGHFEAPKLPFWPFGQLWILSFWIFLTFSRVEFF